MFSHLSRLAAWAVFGKRTTIQLAAWSSSIDPQLWTINYRAHAHICIAFACSEWNAKHAEHTAGHDFPAHGDYRH
jgi:hypothetical protein